MWSPALQAGQVFIFLRGSILGFEWSSAGAAALLSPRTEWGETAETGLSSWRSAGAAALLSLHVLGIQLRTHLDFSFARQSCSSQRVASLTQYLTQSRQMTTRALKTTATRCFGKFMTSWSARMSGFSPPNGG